MIDKIINSILGTDDGERENKDLKKNKKYGNISASKFFENILKKLNSKYSIVETDEDFIKYQAEFQKGIFVVDAYIKSASLVINFINFYETKFDNLSTINYFCNKLNNYSINSKYVYNYFEEDNTINLSIISSLNIYSDDEYFCDLVADTFIQSFYDSRFFVENVENNLDSEEDLFYYISKKDRLKYLILEHDNYTNNLHNYGPSIRERFSFDNSSIYSVFNVLDTIGITRLPDSEFLYTKLITDENVYKFNLEETKNINILSYLVSKNKELICDNLQIIIHYKENNFLFDINLEADVEKAFYFSVCVTYSDYAFNSMKEELSKLDRLSVSFVFACDKVMDSEITAEVEIMVGDTLDKINDNKFEELTDVQREIAPLITWDISDDLYWAEKYFLDKRFYEAIKHFEVVYEQISKNYKKIKKIERESFGDICFKLGYCYSELKNYHKALFYLDFTFKEGLIKGCEEYINCLTNCGDFRNFYVIKNQLSSIDSRIKDFEEEEEEVPSNFIQYKNFLNRRMSYVLIEDGEYDEAKVLLNEMVDSPDLVTRDFAIQELAYIEKVLSQINNQKNKNS